MEIPEDRFRILRSKTQQFGSEKYQGIPCADENLIKLIGWDGVHRIDEILKEAVEIKEQICHLESQLYYKKMSPERSGLSNSVGFADIITQTHIYVHETIASTRLISQRKFITENPILMQNDYEFLRQVDHYLVYDWEQYPPSKQKEFIKNVLEKESVQLDIPIYPPNFPY